MLKLLETLVTVYGDTIEDSEELVIVEAAQFNEAFGPWADGENVDLLQLVAFEDGGVFLEEMVGDKVKHRVKVRLALDV